MSTAANTAEPDDRHQPTNHGDHPDLGNRGGRGADPREPARRPSTRIWTEVGRQFVRMAHEHGRRHHGEYDETAFRTRIDEQIAQLSWQAPNGLVPMSAGLLLRELRPRLPLNVVTAIAVDGAFCLPDGPQTATYGLYGLEGIGGVGGRGRQRLYLADIGIGAFILAADIAVTEPALAPRPAQPTTGPTTGPTAGGAENGQAGPGSGPGSGADGQGR